MCGREARLLIQLIKRQTELFYPTGYNHLNPKSEAKLITPAPLPEHMRSNKRLTLTNEISDVPRKGKEKEPQIEGK